jgi:hypothetical protein
VEIDIHAGLPEAVELEWRGLIQTQTLDFLGVPFRCTRCRQTGHLHRDCQGTYPDDSSSESSLLRQPASSDPPEVSSSGWNVHFHGDASPEADRTDNSFTGKLKSLCLSLYFSLTSWERSSLDHSLVGTLLLYFLKPQSSHQRWTLYQTCFRVGTKALGGSVTASKCSYSLCDSLTICQGGFGATRGCFEFIHSHGAFFLLLGRGTGRGEFWLKIH